MHPHRNLWERERSSYQHRFCEIKWSFSFSSCSSIAIASLPFLPEPNFWYRIHGEEPIYTYIRQFFEFSMQITLCKSSITSIIFTDNENTALWIFWFDLEKKRTRFLENRPAFKFPLFFGFNMPKSFELGNWSLTFPICNNFLISIFFGYWSMNWWCADGILMKKKVIW